MGEIQIEQSTDNNEQYHGVRDSLVAGKKEFAFFFGLLILYFYLRFAGIEPTIVIVLGLIGGIWLAFRPSEWAIGGMESAAGHLGYTVYVAGMLSSLASNLPEAVISGIAASFVLFLSYVIYAGALTTGDVVDNAEKAKSSHSRRTTAILIIIGFIGIFFAGEILTHSVEMLLTDYHDVIGLIGNQVTIAALILGAAGSLPEHGIAVIAAVKGKVELAVGNLIGGVLQIVLLIMGGIGMFVPIPLDRYVLFQIMVIAGSLWFLKRAITDDHKLDFFEGAMIILLQAYVFVLLITGTPI